MEQLQSFPFQLVKRKSLAYIGVFLEVPSLPVIPPAFKEFRELFLAAIGSRSWKSFKNFVFALLTVARWDSPVQGFDSVGHLGSLLLGV